MEDNEKNQLHQINLAFDLITLSFKGIFNQIYIFDIEFKGEW